MPESLPDPIELEETATETPDVPPDAPPAEAPDKLQELIHELHHGILLRAWEAVEATAHKLRQYHLGLGRDEAPQGEDPSERASQVRPMTDQEWEDYQAAKKEPSVEAQSELA